MGYSVFCTRNSAASGIVEDRCRPNIPPEHVLYFLLLAFVHQHWSWSEMLNAISEQAERCSNINLSLHPTTPINFLLYRQVSFVPQFIGFLTIARWYGLIVIERFTIQNLGKNISNQDMPQTLVKICLLAGVLNWGTYQISIKTVRVLVTQKCS